MRFVGVLATGYNIVDVAAADDHDVTVCNIPSYGTDAVAQFAIAMLMEICHGVRTTVRPYTMAAGKTARISASGTHRRSN